MHLGSLGLPELLIILVIVIVIFGAKKLPDLGKSLGEGIKNFKGSVSNKDKDNPDDKNAPSSKS
jgi:sec-independent protein translocase protein TatA